LKYRYGAKLANEPGDHIGGRTESCEGVPWVEPMTGHSGRGGAAAGEFQGCWAS
jgi:hypothetical protein